MLSAHAILGLVKIIIDYHCNGLLRDEYRTGNHLKELERLVLVCSRLPFGQMNSAECQSYICHAHAGTCWNHVEIKATTRWYTSMQVSSI